MLQGILRLKHGSRHWLPSTLVLYVMSIYHGCLASTWLQDALWLWGGSVEGWWSFPGYPHWLKSRRSTVLQLEGLGRCICVEGMRTWVRIPRTCSLRQRQADPGDPWPQSGPNAEQWVLELKRREPTNINLKNSNLLSSPLLLPPSHPPLPRASPSPAFSASLISLAKLSP